MEQNVTEGIYTLHYDIWYMVQFLDSDYSVETQMHQGDCLFYCSQ